MQRSNLHWKLVTVPKAIKYSLPEPQEIILSNTSVSAKPNCHRLQSTLSGMEFRTRQCSGKSPTLRPILHLL